MRVPVWTDFFLTSEGEWVHGGSDATPGRPPAGSVCAVRVFADGSAAERRAMTPSGEPYLSKLLSLHPFEVSEVRAYVVSQHGREEAVVWARTQVEALRMSGLTPDGLAIRER
jgi:hypothetical protein